MLAAWRQAVITLLGRHAATHLQACACWCGATVNVDDVRALMPWLEWARDVASRKVQERCKQLPKNTVVRPINYKT